MKVALVHDWLTGMRGGEKCLEAFLRLYPQAHIFTLIHVPGATTERIDASVKSISYLGKLPGIRKWYRMALPLYPSAASTLDLSGYDLVISLSHAAAKNVRTPASARHVCYCFTPMRYIWDQSRSYFGRATPILWPLIRSLRSWDEKGSDGVEHFVAISRFVAARVRKFYGREAAVIYPPTDLAALFAHRTTPPEDQLLEELGEPAFLCAGALVPYKRIDLAVRACSELGEKLWVVGGGPELERLKKIASPSVRFFGRVSDAVLMQFYGRCKALLFPGVEDFGLIPVECMAHGRPIVGLAAGALRETVQGVFVGEKSIEQIRSAQGVFVRKDRSGDVEALKEAIRYFATVQEYFSRDIIQARATLFSYDRFLSSWTSYCEEWRLPAPRFEGASSLEANFTNRGIRSYA